jgi:hypothetical protein
MKLLTPILILLAFLSLFAQEKSGPMVNVELVSGTKQRAQFLGVERDTVHLGGFINNKFFVVKLPKEKFKSITDSTGKDYLKAEEASTDSSAAGLTDSANVANNISDSAQVQPVKQEVTILDSLLEPTVYVGYESSIADSTLALQIDALTLRFLLESGEKFHAIRRDNVPDCDDNICIQEYLGKLGAKTVYMGSITPVEKKDSITVELTTVLYEDGEELPTIHKNKITLPREKAISGVLSKDKFRIFLMEARGLDATDLKEKKGYVYVETDPEGATLTLASENALCRSPCTFPVEDTASFDLYAYWNVDRHLWGTQVSLHPVMGDTIRRYLKLKPVSPELRIITHPEGAEIYPSKRAISKKSSSVGTTPNRFPISEPGMVQFRLRKFGFKDTLVSVFVPPIADTTVNINLQQETSFEAMKVQQQWQKEQKKRFLGYTLMGASIAPIVVGAIFTYLAQLDYDDAKDIRDDLSQVATSGGDSYRKKIKKNKDLVKQGDRENAIGLSMIGAGVLMLGIGFFISF